MGDQHQSTMFDYLYCLCGNTLRIKLDDPSDDPREYAVCVTADDQLAETGDTGIYVPLVDWWERHHREPGCRPCSAEEYAERESELAYLDYLWSLEAPECRRAS